MLNKLASIIGTVFTICFLVGITITLNKSMMITIFDVFPVYIIMFIAISMMCFDLYTSLKDKSSEK